MSEQDSGHHAADVHEEEDKDYDAKHDKKFKHQDHHTGKKITEFCVILTRLIHTLWNIGEFLILLWIVDHRTNDH